MAVNYKIIATLNQFPSKTIENSFAINLKNSCSTKSFAGASTQAAINYEDGSNTATNVAAFTYTDSTNINADCNITHEIFYRDSENDAWSTSKPAYIPGTPDATVLSFTI